MMDHGGTWDQKVTFYHLNQHPMINVKLDNYVITQRAIEPFDKTSAYLPHTNPINLEIIENNKNIVL